MQWAPLRVHEGADAAQGASAFAVRAAGLTSDVTGVGSAVAAERRGRSPRRGQAGGVEVAVEVAVAVAVAVVVAVVVVVVVAVAVEARCPLRGAERRAVFTGPSPRSFSPPRPSR
jgi:hypothetical protein